MDEIDKRRIELWDKVNELDDIIEELGSEHELADELTNAVDYLYDGLISLDYIFKKEN